MTFVTDCDYCGEISLCFETEGRGTCCDGCSEEHGIDPLEAEWEHDGQPTEYEEWQDVYGGDDWDQGQFDHDEY